MTLRLAPDLDLPDDFATQGVAIIGVRGSGKSNTEVRYAELLHDAGIPFVAVDPKGDWHGIRMAGTGPGLPVPVFGGLYGDFPLDESLGARIADLLVNENLSAVLDVSRLSKTAALPKFLTAFCNQLMDRHQREPHVRTVILEEAHRYIPQVVSSKTSVLKEAAASLLLEGRAFGLGCWACTQRPARLHNDVLEEVDTAVIHRIGVTATADLGRVRKWVEHEDLGPEIGATLTKLATGEAWVLSPVALGIVQRVMIDRRTTFDSGATPIVGATRRTVSAMADIGAPAIKEALSDAIEQAERDDPKRLHAQVTTLTRERDAARGSLIDATRPIEITESIEVPVMPDLSAVEQIVAESYEELSVVAAAFVEEIEGIGDRTVKALSDAVAALHASVERTVDVPAGPSSPARGRSPSASDRAGGVKSDAGAPAARPERSPRGDLPPALDGITSDSAAGRLFAALAMFPDAGRTRRQAAALAGLAVRKSTLRNALSTLRTRGLIIEDGDRLWLSADALALGGDVAPLPTGEALLEFWRGEIGGGAARRVFGDVVAIWPASRSREELGRIAGPGGSTLRNALSSLRSLDLIETAGGLVTASAELMEAVGR